MFSSIPQELLVFLARFMSCASLHMLRCTCSEFHSQLMVMHKVALRTRLKQIVGVGTWTTSNTYRLSGPVRVMRTQPWILWRVRCGDVPRQTFGVVIGEHKMSFSLSQHREFLYFLCYDWLPMWWCRSMRISRFECNEKESMQLMEGQRYTTGLSFPCRFELQGLGLIVRLHAGVRICGRMVKEIIDNNITWSNAYFFHVNDVLFQLS